MNDNGNNNDFNDNGKNNNHNPNHVTNNNRIHNNKNNLGSSLKTIVGRIVFFGDNKRGLLIFESTKILFSYAMWVILRVSLVLKILRAAIPLLLDVTPILLVKILTPSTGFFVIESSNRTVCPLTNCDIKIKKKKTCFII